MAAGLQSSLLFYQMLEALLVPEIGQWGVMHGQVPKGMELTKYGLCSGIWPECGSAADFLS